MVGAMSNISLFLFGGGGLYSEKISYRQVSSSRNKYVGHTLLNLFTLNSDYARN
jgi:hypothetical protein